MGVCILCVSNCIANFADTEYISSLLLTRHSYVHVFYSTVLQLHISAFRIVVLILREAVENSIPLAKSQYTAYCPPYSLSPLE